MKRTSSRSVSAIISKRLPVETGLPGTVNNSVITSGRSALMGYSGSMTGRWVEFILGPAPCQACGRPVEWVRWSGYRFWADEGDDIPHDCTVEPTPRIVPEPQGIPLHQLESEWKKGLRNPDRHWYMPGPGGRCVKTLTVDDQYVRCGRNEASHR